MGSRRIPVVVVTCAALLAACTETHWRTSAMFEEPYRLRLAVGSNDLVRTCVERCGHGRDVTTCASRCALSTVEDGTCAQNGGSREEEVCVDGFRQREQAFEGRNCAAIQGSSSQRLVWCREDGEGHATEFFLEVLRVPFATLLDLGRQRPATRRTSSTSSNRSSTGP
jgi:hypothetical protein